MTHALVTGPITGRIPAPSPLIAGDFLDVTPDVLHFDSHEQALAAAEAIEAEHAARGTHPIQLECKHLDDPEFFPNGADPARVRAHRASHAALNKAQGV